MRKIVWRLVGFGLAALWIFGERGRLLLPSTRRMFREIGWRRALTSLDFLEAYFYARWTRQYVGLSIRHVIPRTHPIEGNNQWADGYHGKILPTPLAQALISVNENIARHNLEQIIPFPAARDLILQSPLDVVAYECGCRAARENPCQPTQVCMVIGQPYADFVLEHNPQTSRRLTQPEALALLQAEHDRGHLHAAYFRQILNNRFYAICNCCACCCAGIESMKHGVPMVISSGYVAQIDDQACQVCGTCENSCPFEAIQVNGSAQVDWNHCMGCGICEGQCPNDAITLVLDARKGEPLDIRTLAPQAVN